MAYQQGYRPQARAQGGSRKQSAAAGRKAQRGREAKARKRRSPFRVFFALVFFALVATVGVMGYMVYEEVGSVERENTFYPGVYVDGVELHGATPQQAYDFLMAKAQAELNGWFLELAYGGQSWRITPETLGMDRALSAAVEDAVNKAFFVGRTGSVLERYQAILGLKLEPYEAYTAEVQKSMGAIDDILAQIQAAVYVAPRDAERFFYPDNSRPVVISPEQYGQELDVPALKAQIVRMINTMEAGTLAVTPTPIAPTITAAMLERDFVQLASFSTPIARDSTNERNMNIERGLSAFHGIVVKAGEEVSFNGKVGKRTTANGFYEALEIVSGSLEYGVGGGICQVSSTLYNAVIQAGLRVVSRTNHGIPVNYIDMGADATVSDRGIDFRFKNDTGADIYLIARLVTNGKQKSCLVQIYGRPDPNGYSYSLRHETIEEIPVPSPTRILDKNAEHVKYTDQTYEVKGKPGYRVRTYLLIKDGYGNVVSEKELYVDRYEPQAPKIYVGVTPRE